MCVFIHYSHCLKIIPYLKTLEYWLYQSLPNLRISSLISSFKYRLKDLAFPPEAAFLRSPFTRILLWSRLFNILFAPWEWKGIQPLNVQGFTKAKPLIRENQIIGRSTDIIENFTKSDAIL